MFEYFLLFVVLCYVIDQLINRKTWNTLRKIPGCLPLPLIGNIRDITKDSRKNAINPTAKIFQYLEGASLLFRKEKIYIVWVGRNPAIFLNAPETVEPLLNSNAALEKGSFYNYLTPWLGDGLVTSSGDKWRHHRKLLTPSFHFRILDNFVPVMNEQADILVHRILAAMATEDWIDSFDYYSKCTLDIICETAMGIKIGAQQADSTYTKMVHDISNEVLVRSSKPWLDSDMVYYMTGGAKTFRKAVEYLHGVTDKVISEKISERKITPNNKENGDANAEPGTKKRLAFLDLLLENELSSQEMREQVDTFMFAGHDTTATALSWMTYLLGLHPDVQDKLIEEVDHVFGGDLERHVTPEDLKKLKYMDLVIKESQRVYPSVPQISRKVDKDMEIGGYMIPKGTECFLSIYSVHHHPDHYPNPEIFDPERFSPENSAGRHPYSFIPFSAGPRNCIGQRFALLEQKIIACHVFRRLRVISLDQRDQIKLMPELILKADPRIRIRFTPRR